MSQVAASGMGGAGPAADPQAPYVRLAVVGLICRTTEAGETHWLLLHRTRPLEAWDPPGGRMETGEDLIRAVRREVEEETGLAVEVGGPCYAFLTFYKGERLLAVSMACRPVSDPDTIRLEPDGPAGWRWASRQEWEQLAADGISSWDPADVKKATRTVAALWEAEQG
jgi:8-oxo-dGTP pyrophosphatase MutT (NUDIX family)